MHDKPIRFVYHMDCGAAFTVCRKQEGRQKRKSFPDQFDAELDRVMTDLNFRQLRTGVYQRPPYTTGEEACAILDNSGLFERFNGD